MGVPETDPLRRRIKLEDSIDSAKMQRAEPPPSPPQTVTVLLVAIDGHTLCRITDQLQPPHYQFCTSPTVNSALGLLQMEDLQVDLVLSNVSSKDDDDGYNFIAQVQRLRKNIPHVVIFEAEGLGDPEIIRAKNLGACYILWKPLIEQSNVIKYLRQHVYVFTRSPHSENEGSSSLLSSQQKSLKRERDEQSSEKERESSKKQRRMVWDKDFDKDLNALFVKAVNELGDGK
ncbi:hypothetical protein QN277_029375 [Acacia crassicarpa]|uniref:Response regulatory domain-containing protein n=1 Tax=Acacia crassicarpa TaxID=499986 RepID=A0AAE1K2L8_9FABA|nr:hypothetical protein QN277_029375 [Acacia crassicarpa]